MTAGQDDIGLHSAECKLRLHMSPAYMMDPHAGIFEILSRSLLRYVDRLQGVVLSFSDVELLDTHGTIVQDQPNIHLNVSMTALLFAPVEGQHLSEPLCRRHSH